MLTADSKPARSPLACFPPPSSKHTPARPTSSALSQPVSPAVNERPSPARAVDPPPPPNLNLHADSSERARKFPVQVHPGTAPSRRRARFLLGCSNRVAPRQRVGWDRPQMLRSRELRKSLRASPGRRTPAPIAVLARWLPRHATRVPPRRRVERNGPRTCTRHTPAAAVHARSSPRRRLRIKCTVRAPARARLWH